MLTPIEAVYSFSEKLTSGEIKVLQKSLPKIKKVFKKGFYVFDNQTIVADYDSDVELYGDTIITLSEEVHLILDRLEMPSLWYMEHAADCKTTSTDLMVFIFPEDDPIELEKIRAKYQEPITEYLKRGNPIYEFYHLVNWADSDRFFQEYFDMKRSVEATCQNHVFYHSAYMFPYLTAKNIKDLKYSMDLMGEDSPTGYVYFLQDIGVLKVEMLIQFIKF